MNLAIRPKYLVVISLLLTGLVVFSQPVAPNAFTHADTLRGTITPERGWWDVKYYDITVKPEFNTKTTSGKTTISYQVTKAPHPAAMQIDLQEPLHIDSIFLDGKQKLGFKQEGNAWHVAVAKPQADRSLHKLTIYYSGTPHEGVNPPWSGGWTWKRDSLNRPWYTVTCQGLGASVWYPCKDHQSDEPDNGASLTMIVPDTLVGVAMGRLKEKKMNGDGTASYTWAVVNPINNYDIIPYIGKYVNFSGTYKGEKGNLDLNYWVLDYNLAKAKAYLPRETDSMLRALEYWLGPYPFYEDGFKLVDAMHNGMEHQSAVAYGNGYKPGYRGRDGSGTGWGMKWDFIVMHESGHEWFGNSITSKDLADMWIHEGFTNYSETLYVDYLFGKQAGDEYNAGTRRGIRNDRPIIAHYGVNEQGSGDMYPKSGNMFHAIRHSMDNDDQFRKIWRGLSKTFYHQTVTAAQIENYISANAGFNFRNVFDQYLTTTQIPNLELKFNADKSKVNYRYTNCLPGFNLPLTLKSDAGKLKIYPTTTVKTLDLKPADAPLLGDDAVIAKYYLTVSH